MNAQKDFFARKSERTGDDVLLIAVTKTRSVEEIKEAISCGITDIGENRVQEILDKYDQVDKSVKWHLIGHLQTNKVKYIIDKVHMIHSVDSFKLAREINVRAANAGIVANILIQVNAAQEESKFGISKDGVEQLLFDILESCEHIKVRGLMHIAPFAEDPEEVREYFRDVKDLYRQFSKIKHDRANFTMLSMGMSNDFGVAIEEGSNAIRVGTSIFGNRDYSKI
ncbi:MAG: YggS family pyridoxal phosphate-dependent enzyme [Candidatus Moranbacteria bacterium]|nr:YggS family pyridoxal phosphate-dependent enzyme [Candidatus Moranbacteria bacterium]